MCIRDSRSTRMSPGWMSPRNPPKGRVASPSEGEGRPCARSRSAVDPCAPAAGELEHLGLGDHGRVARGGHRERTVCRAVLDGGLERDTLEQAVDESRRERVTPAHPVEDLDAFPVPVSYTHLTLPTIL